MKYELLNVECDRKSWIESNKDWSIIVLLFDIRRCNQMYHKKAGERATGKIRLKKKKKWERIKGHVVRNWARGERAVDEYLFPIELDQSRRWWQIQNTQNQFERKHFAFCEFIFTNNSIFFLLRCIYSDVAACLLLFATLNFMFNACFPFILHVLWSVNENEAEIIQIFFVSFSFTLNTFRLLLFDYSK